MITKYMLAWLVLPVIGIVNGIMRQVGYRDLLGDLAAHQVSTVTAILLFALYVWWLSRRWPLTSVREAITVGLLWLALTVAFEFLFGHYIMGNSWERLLHDYNLFDGHVWVFVLIWITIAPYVFYRLSAPKTAVAH
ncbi:MAG: hypothetical protein R6W76_23430 [Caldilinea sp.]